MLVLESAVDVLLDGREHVFRVIGHLLKNFLVIAWILKLEIVSLSDDHEQILEIFLLNMQLFVHLIDLIGPSFGKVLFLVAKKLQVLNAFNKKLTYPASKISISLLESNDTNELFFIFY